MPTRSDLIEQVASQMMKGGRPGRLKATIKQRVSFQKRHTKHIEWAIEHLPRCTAAVPAVVVKCLIKYDQNTVAAFCKALRYSLFNGQNDPAYLLWKFLQKHRGHDTVTAYRHAVCAAKAYMEGRTLQTVRPVKEDVFAWDEGWTVPDDLLVNWQPDNVPGEPESATLRSEGAMEG